MSTMDEQMSNSTWTQQRIFDPTTVKKSTTITWRERLRLLFVRNQYAFEDSTMIRYKKLGDVAYILEIKGHSNAKN